MVEEEIEHHSEGRRRQKLADGLQLTNAGDRIPYSARLEIGHW